MVMKRISIAVCLLVAACGDAQESEPVEPEPTAYEDMNFEQRYAFMNNVVLPEMKAIFVKFDPKFETMTCATCHGAGATDGSYAMPASDLPRLPATEEEFAVYMMDPEHAKWGQWMIDEVWPQMANLLKVAPFDPMTSPNGFSCHNCHKVEGEP
jgi:cytochrome c553